MRFDILAFMHYSGFDSVRSFIYDDEAKLIIRPEPRISNEYEHYFRERYFCEYRFAKLVFRQESVEAFQERFPDVVVYESDFDRATSHAFTQEHILKLRDLHQAQVLKAKHLVNSTQRRRSGL